MGVFYAAKAIVGAPAWQSSNQLVKVGLCTMPCSASCQEKNDALFIQGAGRQYIEPTEPIWAALYLLGVITQVRS